MIACKITSVGSSAGIILTREALAMLKVQKGDTIYLTEAPDGACRVTVHDPVFEEQMQMAEDIMHKHREVLRALAK